MKQLNTDHLLTACRYEHKAEDGKTYVVQGDVMYKRAWVEEWYGRALDVMAPPTVSATPPPTCDGETGGASSDAGALTSSASTLMGVEAMVGKNARRLREERCGVAEAVPAARRLEMHAQSESSEESTEPKSGRSCWKHAHGHG